MRLLFFTILILGLTKASPAQNQAGYIKEGNRFFKEGNLSAAIAAYSKVTDEKYRYTALLNKGTALYKQKNEGEALKAWKELANAPGAKAVLRSGAHYNTGVVYSNQKKIAESIEAYQQALRLNSNDAQARENLQKALLEQKKSGGGGGEERPQKTSSSRLNANQVQQQLNRLRQKEKTTKSRVKGKKGQLGEVGGKDW